MPEIKKNIVEILHNLKNGSQDLLNDAENKNSRVQSYRNVRFFQITDYILFEVRHLDYTNGNIITELYSFSKICIYHLAYITSTLYI